jgi:formylglycine-generating enzyme required for sulfatase activity
VVATSTQTTYTPGELLPTTTYYWQVIAQNAGGATAPGPVWRFTTSVAPPDPTAQVLIPAGSFQMGCDAGNPAEFCFGDEQPLHSVTLSAYYIDKYEVTNARYQACVDAGECTPPIFTTSFTRAEYYGNPTYADYPVIYVDWFQAAAFCTWEGKRLPTEAEWEKAARGSSDTRKYPWGNEAPTCDRMNAYVGDDYCVGDTTAVGSYPTGASPYGVMDMAGSVWEWVNDWYDGDYYSVSPPSNPPGPAMGTRRILRGGSWDYDVRALRVASRDWSRDPTYDDLGIGFRCAASLP